MIDTMFKETDTHSQLDLFSNPATQLGKRGAKKYDNPAAWCNQFYQLVTCRVNESLFAPLFKAGNMGAPNASIRIIIAMCVLKEGMGCSDEELFERCEFDLLIRKSLGLMLLNDVCPSLDTYYLFRRRICDYESETQINLMEKCFEQITHSQVCDFKISGKSVRMDSKLIGSNIAWYSRFELIYNTLVDFLKHISESDIARLPPKLHSQIEPYLDGDPQKMVYRLSSEEIGTRLTNLGQFIYALLKKLHITDDQILLHRVFHEQFIVTKGRVTPLAKEDISAKSLQNHNDPDATYRRKEDQKVKGYSTNLTETCDPNEPSLVIGAEVKPVSASDNEYFQDAIRKAQENVLENKVENIHADGAYQSPENREYAEKENINLYLTGLQGRLPNNLLRYTEGNLTATDRLTGENIPCTLTKKGKWRIKTKKGYRYLVPKDIEMAQLREEIKSIPPEKQMMRNNVEATIFQYCYHTRNNKTRYRGLLKHKLFTFARCLWMNCVRLTNYLIKTGGRIPSNPVDLLFFPKRTFYRCQNLIFHKPIDVFLTKLIVVNCW